ncbi:MAG: dephospho-CoA kinase [Flavobacteriaceae bacterium]|nr:dephospho-CoA kinase [Flavobacteriaceae bacterium]
MVVGITGGIGSGKSFVAKQLCSYQKTAYYHADEEAKKLMNQSDEIKNQLLVVFGKDSYVNNQLNKAYISSIVFRDATKLEQLNSIVHPIVKKHFKDFINKQTDDVLIIYENAILFETGSDIVCDHIIAVNAILEDRINRVMNRDKIKRDAVMDRVKNQWYDFKRNMLSNYTILNLDKKETLLKIKKIHKILTKKQSIF